MAVAGAAGPGRGSMMWRRNVASRREARQSVLRASLPRERLASRELPARELHTADGLLYSTLSLLSHDGHYQSTDNAAAAAAAAVSITISAELPGRMGLRCPALSPT